MTRNWFLAPDSDGPFAETVLYEATDGYPIPLARRSTTHMAVWAFLEETFGRVPFGRVPLTADELDDLAGPPIADDDLQPFADAWARGLHQDGAA